MKSPYRLADRRQYDPNVKVLLVSADPKVRETMELTVRGVKRAVGDRRVEFLEATDGLQGMQLAWRLLPDLVVADEITSRAGAFALAKDLKGALPPHPARIVILLDRAQDEWLAAWSEADAWFVKPVNPFELADALTALLGAPHQEGRPSPG